MTGQQCYYIGWYYVTNRAVSIIPHTIVAGVANIPIWINNNERHNIYGRHHSCGWRPFRMFDRHYFTL